MKKHSKGIHIIADFFECDLKKTSDMGVNNLKKNISNEIKKVGLTELGNYYHEFSDISYTGVIALAESHISFHIWEEDHYVTVDIYVCNYSKDNSDGPEKLFDFFKNLFNPTAVKRQNIIR